MSLKVGITGGIGSGKSIVCRIFSELGIPIYDADTRAKLILIDNLELREQIVTAFGKESYLADGGLNRVFLARSVFSNEKSAAQLNALVHPKVGEDYRLWERQNESAPYTLKEAALLFESGSYEVLDAVIVVAAPEELRISRVLDRDSQRNREDVVNIIARQMDEKEKLAKADHVISNDGCQMLIPQVLELHRKFLAGA